MTTTGLGPVNVPEARSRAESAPVGPVESAAESRRVDPESGSTSAGRASGAAESAPAGAAITPEDLAPAVSVLKEFIQDIQRSLDFSIDEVTGKTVVTVRNRDTDEILRQIPPEEVLAVARALAEFGQDGYDQLVSGLLVDREA
jgi:flagellar protein FlaG